MTTSHPVVRRATIDDLRPLAELWGRAELPARELEPRFKEFQVAEDSAKRIVGTIGLLVAGTEGLLHHEAYAEGADADALRALLWERLQSMARNHGLIRIWTQLPGPFWPGVGMQEPSSATHHRLPPAFGAGAAPWHVLQLREELPAALAADQEFLLFREAQKEQTAKMMRQAKVLKMVALGISIILLVIIVLWAVFFVRLQQRRPGAPGTVGWRPSPAQTVPSGSGTAEVLWLRRACS